MNEKQIMQQKIKVLSKLYDNGCNNEKKLQKLSMESILKIPGITISDMNIILDLQKSTKAGKLFSYIGGSIDEETKPQRQTHYLE